MPMARLKIMMMPKCTGSTPMVCARGRKMGVAMMRMEPISMIMPSRTRMTVVSSRIRYRLLVSPSTREDSRFGTFSSAMMKPKIAEKPMDSNMMAMVCTARLISLQNFSKVISL